jgi:hypothetical protein
MRIIFTFLAALIFSTSNAQEITGIKKHLMFNGVPITGTLNEYVNKMKEQGFIHVETMDETAILKGDFAGYKYCVLGVSVLKMQDLVYKIDVSFPESTSWSSLSKNYFSLKEMLTDKYGNPQNVTEKFIGYSQPSDDKSKMIELEINNCKYSSTWQTEYGNIHLTIDFHHILGSHTRLEYIDKINSNIIKKKAIGVL